MKVKLEKILHNRVRCLKCETVIESRHRHDFVTCPCGEVSVDGGKDYLRRLFKQEENFEDLSESVHVIENVTDPFKIKFYREYRPDWIIEEAHHGDSTTPDTPKDGGEH